MHVTISVTHTHTHTFTFTRRRKKETCFVLADKWTDGKSQNKRVKVG